MSEIIYFEEADSSNNVAMNLIGKQHLSEFSIVLVKNQTKGKGQGSNSWYSKPNESITLSIIVYPLFLLPEHFFFISKLTAIVTHKLINKYTKNAYIKWPNDIYVNNKKIAGILIENIISQQQMQASIIGVGINVNQATFPSNLPNPTSLFLETKNNYSIDLLVSQWQQIFIEHYSWLKSKNFEQIDKYYNKYLFMKNKNATFLTNKQEILEGTILKVNNAGELVVLVNNKKRNFNIGELDLILKD